MGKEELGAAENINDVRVGYGNDGSLQFIVEKQKCDRGAQSNGICEENRSAMSEMI